MTAQVAADLRAAAEVLRRDGWTQGWLHTDEGCHCLLGALDVVVGYVGDKWSSEAAAREEAATERLAPVIGTVSLISWNDTEGRTADEVIAALEAAADAAEVQP